MTPIEAAIEFLLDDEACAVANGKAPDMAHVKVGKHFVTRGELALMLTTLKDEPFAITKPRDYVPGQVTMLLSTCDGKNTYHSQETLRYVDPQAGVAQMRYLAERSFLKLTQYITDCNKIPGEKA